MEELDAANGTLTLKQWIDRTGAKGIITLPGRYGGTYAAPEIADDFEIWVSPRYRFYAFQRNRHSLVQWIKELEELKQTEAMLQQGKST